MDRRNAPEYQSEITGKDKFKKVPMLSAFSRLADLHYRYNELTNKGTFEVLKDIKGQGVSNASKRFFPSWNMA